MHDARAKWDARYRDNATPGAPAGVLADNTHLLPARGEALDLACGLGANALLLAGQGLRVHAWDISGVAMECLRARAPSNLSCEQRDVLARPPTPRSFDVIVVSNFLSRGLENALIAALRPEGLLFYQTFIRDKRDPIGPAKPEFLLRRNELLTMFADLKPVFYREDAGVGRLEHGERNQAMYVGQRG